MAEATKTTACSTTAISRSQQCARKTFSTHFVSLSSWKITFHCIIPGSSLSFEVDEKPAFIVPLKDVSQATTGRSVILLFFIVTSVRSGEMELSLTGSEALS